MDPTCAPRPRRPTGSCRPTRGSPCTTPPWPPRWGRSSRSAPTAASRRSIWVPRPRAGDGAVRARPPPGLRGEPGRVGVPRARPGRPRRPGCMDTLPVLPAHDPRGRARGLGGRRSSATRPRSAAHWAHAARRCCSSTAATAPSRPTATTRAGRRRSRPGGLLAIHDVFPDPADGGRPPLRDLLPGARSGGVRRGERPSARSGCSAGPEIGAGRPGQSAVAGRRSTSVGELGRVSMSAGSVVVVDEQRRRPGCVPARASAASTIDGRGVGATARRRGSAPSRGTRCRSSSGRRRSRSCWAQLEQLVGRARARRRRGGPAAHSQVSAAVIHGRSRHAAHAPALDDERVAALGSRRSRPASPREHAGEHRVVPVHRPAVLRGEGVGRRVRGSTWASRAADSSQSGRSWPSCSAMAMAQRRLWQMLDEPVSRANDHGVPSAWRAQRISPRGVCRSSTKSMARSTTGHIVSRKPAVVGEQPVVPHAGGDVGEDVGVELVLLDPVGQVVLVPGAVGALQRRPASRRPARPRPAGRRGRGPWPPRRGSTGRRGRRGTTGSCPFGQLPRRRWRRPWPAPRRR